jgi:3-phosphoglycerate kinase
MIVTGINDDRHRNAHVFLNCDFNTPLAFLGDVPDKMNIL